MTAQHDDSHGAAPGTPRLASARVGCAGAGTVPRKRWVDDRRWEAGGGRDKGSSALWRGVFPLATYELARYGCATTAPTGWPQ